MKFSFIYIYLTAVTNVETYYVSFKTPGNLIINLYGAVINGFKTKPLSNISLSSVNNNLEWYLPYN